MGIHEGDNLRVGPVCEDGALDGPCREDVSAESGLAAEREEAARGYRRLPSQTRRVSIVFTNPHNTSK